MVSVVDFIYRFLFSRRKIGFTTFQRLLQLRFFLTLFSYQLYQSLLTRGSLLPSLALPFEHPLQVMQFTHLWFQTNSLASVRLTASLWVIAVPAQNWRWCFLRWRKSHWPWKIAPNQQIQLLHHQYWFSFHLWVVFALHQLHSHCFPFVFSWYRLPKDLYFHLDFSSCQQVAYHLKSYLLLKFPILIVS